MRILIDTNVLLDFYEERPAFIAAAEKILLLCAKDHCAGIVCASAVTDIYYLLGKALGRDTALDCIKKMLGILKVADVGRGDLHRAATSGMADFEDAVLAFSAKRAKADYIVTRNISDFQGSPVPAISPQDFIAQLPHE